MLYTEKELQDTLKKDVTISKETEKRMQETYAQIPGASDLNRTASVS